MVDCDMEWKAGQLVDGQCITWLLGSCCKAWLLGSCCKVWLFSSSLMVSSRRVCDGLQLKHGRITVSVFGY